jgi:hypothetical protein
MHDRDPAHAIVAHVHSNIGARVDASSQQRHRITIEGHAQPFPCRHREPLEKVPANPRQLVRMLALEKYVPAPACLDPLDGTRRRPDHGETDTLARANQAA